MQDHEGASVYYEADLPPEGTVETVREVREDSGEELSGEGDVVESLRSGAVMGTMTWVRKINGVVWGTIGTG